MFILFEQCPPIIRPLLITLTHTMKYLFLLWSLFSILHPPEWSTDFNDAKLRAGKEHKYILLNFSGSDWCGPCVRLRKEIFEGGSFLSFANDHLLLVNADFPRMKKNQLTAVLTRQNDLLADQYNPTGIFPYTLLLDAGGKVLRSWEGYPKEGADAFLKEITSMYGNH